MHCLEAGTTNKMMWRASNFVPSVLYSLYSLVSRAILLA